MKKTPKAPTLREHHPDTMKSLVAIAVGLFILILFTGLYMNYKTTVGRAFQIIDPVEVNLAEEGSAFIAQLPDIGREISVNLSMVLADVPEKYNFTLLRLDQTTYSYTLQLFTPQGPQQQLQEQRLVAVDQLQQPETAQLHLPTNSQLVPDTIADLEVSFVNNQLMLRNLHFLPPNSARIVLLNNSGTREVFANLIRLQPRDTFSATINVSSRSKPIVHAQIDGQVLTLTDITPDLPVGATNFSTWDLTYAVPADASSGLLNITAVVQGQTTQRYYRLAIGDTAFTLMEPNFPQMTITLDPAAPESSLVRLRAVFADTTDLQPFALPCQTTTSLQSLFSDTAVARVYSYGYSNGGTPQLWTNGSVVNDFTTLDAFKGYFVQLSQAGASENARTMVITCTLHNPLPGTGAQFTLNPGWTLFSLPGTIPHPLTDFTSQEFRVYEYQSGMNWVEQSPHTLLMPGKPYWINVTTAQPIIIPYQWQ